MTIDIRYTEDGLGVELLASGAVTGADIMDALRTIYGDDRFNDIKYLIADKTACTDYRVTTRDVMAIASLDNAASQENPDLIEVHVTPTGDARNMSVMWQAFTERGRSRSQIFRDRKNADAWVAKQLSGASVINKSSSA